MQPARGAIARSPSTCTPWRSQVPNLFPKANNDSQKLLQRLPRSGFAMRVSVSRQANQLVARTSVPLGAIAGGFNCKRTIEASPSVPQQRRTVDACHRVLHEFVGMAPTCGVATNRSS
ncbi:hypothetical protein [Microcoleus sp. MON2_D5]|uniref:hypothetical protein n=1 Tax=Microcoleus sp. MON2_D5 TaxID=2818833 RepID=UPI002FD42D32